MKKSIFLFSAVLFLVLSGCVYAVRYDGEYTGRVIDAGTGEPIEGAVVLGVWTTEFLGAGGAAHKFHDAKETITDKNGGFSISGEGVEIMSNVTPMDVLIFKAGYEKFGCGPWESLRIDEILKTKIKWEGNRAIIPLKKLAIAERREQGDPSYPYAREIIIERKLKLMLEETDKERVEMGFRPLQKK